MTAENVINSISVELSAVRSALLKWSNEDITLLMYKPIQNGGWSSLGILEHITLTSHYLLKIIDKASVKAIQQASSNDVSIDWDTYDLLPKRLEEVGDHKSFFWNRPEHMEPSYSASLSDIMSKMTEQFDRCENLLCTIRNGEGRLRKTTMSVNNIGKLDVYQYIYFLILHAKRHVTQLEKNKTEFELKTRCN